MQENRQIQGFACVLILILENKYILKCYDSYVSGQTLEQNGPVKDMKLTYAVSRKQKNSLWGKNSE